MILRRSVGRSERFREIGRDEKENEVRVGKREILYQLRRLFGSCGKEL
jgi:hypothetical protein